LNGKTENTTTRQLIYLKTLKTGPEYTICLFKAEGVKAGVVINPGTPVQAIKHVLGLVDQVLVMTVNPGFGGQAFLPETLVKVSELASLREQEQLQFDIEVDGGIDNQTIKLAKEAGANVFVAGSYVFKGDVDHQVQTLKEALHD